MCVEVTMFRWFCGESHPNWQDDEPVTTIDCGSPVSCLVVVDMDKEVIGFAGTLEGFVQRCYNGKKASVHLWMLSVSSA